MNRILRLTLLFLSSSLLFGHSQAVSYDVKTAHLLAWNVSQYQAPFIVDARPSWNEAAGPLLYRTGGLSFPLTQPLVFDAKCDCYSVMVQANDGAIQLVSLWRTRGGFYRSGNGPYLEIRNIDSLRSLTTINGTQLLFAQVGDGELSCVAAHDAFGNYLMVDYKADGSISRLRDSVGRSATVSYVGGRIESVMQSWMTSEREMRSSTIRINSK